MARNIAKQFYRPDEVAQLMNVTRRTVYRMILDGRLPGVNLHQRPRRIPREALQVLAPGLFAVLRD